MPVKDRSSGDDVNRWYGTDEEDDDETPSLQQRLIERDREEVKIS